jgi:hypothetical protein
VPALERLHGLRVVADAQALDAARWHARDAMDVIVLRLAPDDAFAIGAAAVEVDDPHAIVEDERGFIGGWGDADEIALHAEWPLPHLRPALAQGAIAGVPAKVWLPEGQSAADDRRALLVTAGAYAAVLAERLGWTR